MGLPSRRTGKTSMSRIYAATQSTVSVIHTTTNPVVNTVPVGIKPAGVAAAPDGKQI